jgi:hypothetical protein
MTKRSEPRWNQEFATFSIDRAHPDARTHLIASDLTEKCRREKWNLLFFSPTFFCLLEVLNLASFAETYPLQAFGVMTSTPKYGASAAGTRTEPSVCW